MPSPFISAKELDIPKSISAIVIDGTAVEKEKFQRYFDCFSIGNLIPDGVITTEQKISLPTNFEGVSVTWTSDNEGVVSANGTVKLPSQETTVTLSATLAIDGKSLLKNFKVRVIPESDQSKYFTDNFTISYILAGGMKLQNTFCGKKITWSGSDAVSSEGVITAKDQEQTVTLKATLEAANVNKSFPVKILTNKSEVLAAYTREPVANNIYTGKLGYSMHLSYLNSERSFQALNRNTGVLYAKATEETNKRTVPKNLKNPYIFYLKDGTYGIVAVRTSSEYVTDNNVKYDVSNLDDNQSKGKVLLFTTKDFIKYEEKGLIDLKGNTFVSDVTCDFDSSSDQYIIRWCDESGNYYKNTMSDVLSLDGASAPEQGSILTFKKEAIDVTGAWGRNSIYVPETIGKRVITKLSPLYNTGVELPNGLQVKSADDIKNVKAKVMYNDGSSANKSVNWNLDNIDFSKPGEYTISGVVKQSPSMRVDQNPMAVDRADPCIYFKDGYYYFIATNDKNGNATFSMKKATTIEGLKDAEEVEILHVDMYEDMNMVLWAPEIHEINGQIYIFFASNPADGWNVQCYITKLKAGGDMLNKDDWEKPSLFKGKTGQPLTKYGIGGITLDMTTFVVKGQRYVMWSQRDFGAQTGAWMYIGTIDSENPYQLTSDPVAICKPHYGWDNNDDTPVDEGPNAIITDEKVYITFSGSSVGAPYCVGYLEIGINEDLLDANNWTKGNYPIVDAYTVEGERGPGHNSYTRDEDGNLVFVYHARPVDKNGNAGSRTTGLRTVHFDIDGDPVLYMTSDVELKEEFRNVQMKVVVPPDFTKSTVNNISDQVYTGKEVTPDFVVTLDGKALVKERDYTISYSNNINLGEATATITGKGTYVGNITKTFQIVVEKNQVITVKGYKYKVTNAITNGKGTVAMIGNTKKTSKSVKVADSVKIGGKTFNVTEVGNAAFKNYKKLTSVVIGKNVTSIGAKSFYNCKALKKISVNGQNIKKVGKNSLKGIHAKAKILVPSKKLKAYKKLFSNKGQGKNVAIMKK